MLTGIRAEMKFRWRTSYMLDDCDDKTPNTRTEVSLGSLYAGAVGSNGELLMWGYSAAKAPR